MPSVCSRCGPIVEGNSNALSCPKCGGELARDSIPDQIGRYAIRECIGSGATAVVYKGHDVGLHRFVAVKVPRPHLVASTETANAFLSEARTLASLEHPNIVPIYDLGRTDEGLCFLVCKLFDGNTLQHRLARERASVAVAVEVTRRVAEALHHAHRHGLVHRDVKPANILLDAEGRPVLADFDLALHPRDFGKGPTFVGTVSYMSPEQARREGHRVDARTDVYGLGVVLYEMLTGRLPFESEQRDDLLEQIRSCAPLPLRQLDASVPPELERICLKAIAKLPSERYATAQEMADELHHFQIAAARLPATEAAASLGARPAVGVRAIIPRGLRSFSARDADFFLELLPGPRDRVGLPEAVRFWKERLESTDADSACRVALMLGPTGCGKSSLMLAGILPRLASSVCAVRIESTPDETESRLVQSLRKRRPDLPRDATLAEMVGRLRVSASAPTKVVLVLDQFEQWLHAHAEYAETPLVAALRQCDGVHVQALLLVRDDFSLAAARFLHELEVPIVEGVNFATVDRFSTRHARKVLAAFGRAYGTLPADPVPLAPEQEQFLAQAVEELTEEGRVIPVRLVLLAEMMKARPWTAAMLREVGGATGSAVVFLEEALGSRAVNPAHRPFHRAACAVLHSLLPARGEKLKGVQRSTHDLLAASGLADRPGDFDALMTLLSGELRLITPTDMEPGTASAAERPAAFYQLTHDYLVSALRLWLTQQQRGTRQGRAQLRLAEFSDDWNVLPESRRLPGVWTWATILLWTRQRDWTMPQRAMVRAATRHHLVRGAMILTLVLLLFQGWRYLGQREAAELAAQHAADLVAELENAPIRNVSGIIESLERDWTETEPRMQAALREPGLAPSGQRNLRLALLHSDPHQVAPLVQYVLVARPDELLVLRQSLWPYRAQINEGLWQVVQSPHEEVERRVRAAGALAGMDAESPRWAEVGETVATALLQQNPLELPQWLEVFRPVRRSLLPALARVFRAPSDSIHGRLAALILADFAADEPTLAVNLLLSAAPELYRIVWPAFRHHAEEAVEHLKEVLGEVADAKKPLPDIGRRQAQAAVILLQLGHPDRVWPLLHHRADPTMRSWLVYLLGALRTDPQLLVERWQRESDAGARRALILGLGECDPALLRPERRQSLVAEWLALYRNDPDPGLHGAIDWTLRQRWKHGTELAAIDRELTAKARDKKSWFVNGQGQTLVFVPANAALPSIGEKPGTRIPRAFAIGARNVTVAEYDRFQKAHPAYRYEDFPKEYIQGPTSPMIWLSWFDAAAYCRWLSEQEGVPEEEMCYPPLAQIRPGMKLPANYLARTGYRLPTATEWEIASRAGATTPRYFGRGEALVAHYGWYANIAAAHVHPAGSLKPNDLGLFDVYGNTWEWSHDRAFRPWAAQDREDAADVDPQTPRLIFGGSFVNQSSALSSTSWVPRKPGECHIQYGMRLTQTVR